MGTIDLIYRGKKSRIHLRMPWLSQEYKFRKGTAIPVDTGDAEKILRDSPRSFVKVAAPAQLVPVEPVVPTTAPAEKGKDVPEPEVTEEPKDTKESEEKDSAPAVDDKRGPGRPPKVKIIDTSKAK